MSGEQPSDAYRSGQLYAALATLQKLGDIDFCALGRPESRARAAAKPLTHLREPLWMVGKSYDAARRRGRAAAAGAVFRSIPDLMPSGRELPGSLGPEQQQEFLLGWQAQVDAIAEETGYR
ncbi:hypothetical protein ACFT7S_10530 [Streptomyces sp. NPDC057136]|uniref:hypothetical protein n=1 Tax=Streptomyces sp. NPDC057136 TaxID=3346029 RepID=UPI0036441D50